MYDGYIMPMSKEEEQILELDKQIAMKNERVRFLDRMLADARKRLKRENNRVYYLRRKAKLKETQNTE